MGRENQIPSDIENNKIVIPSSSQQSRNDNTIHPVSIDTPSATNTPSSNHHQQQQMLFSKPFKSWFPWLIPSFVVINVVLFLITMSINNCPKNSTSCIGRFLGRFSFQPFKENPLLGPSSYSLDKMGALEVNKVVHGGQGWRLFTCMWLHAGVFHILANMLSLLFIGIRLEQEFGFVRIGLLYIIAGMGGSLLSALFIQSSISVGASGALFGLLGGMLSELITNWTIYANKFATLLTLVVIIAINLSVGILPHVDNFAHIGGFVSGFLVGFVFLMRPQFGWVNQRNVPPRIAAASSAKAKHKTYQYVLWVTALILLIAGFTVGLVLLFRGFDANKHCSWCHYMSCIPTKRWSCNNDPVTCMSSQTLNQLNLTCSPNGKTNTYQISNATDNQIRQICAQLCS